jgi:hypothetical protein
MIKQRNAMGGSQSRPLPESWAEAELLCTARLFTRTHWFILFSVVLPAAMGGSHSGLSHT